VAGVTALELLEDELKRRGFDGLYSETGCCCFVGDLVPCAGSWFRDCRAGYRQIRMSEDFGKEVPCIGPEKEEE